MSGLMRGMNFCSYQSRPLYLSPQVARQHAGEERDAEVDEHASRDLADGDVHGRPLEAEERRQLGDEDPGEDAVEEHLEDGVEGDEAGSVLGVALGELVPDDHHRDAAREAHHDESDHELRVVVQEDDRQQEHDDRPDDPVLHQREAEDPVVAEDVAEFLVAHLGERRIHHHDEADGDGDVGGAHGPLLDELRDALVGPAEADADEHGEEDPERQVAVEEREALGHSLGHAASPCRSGRRCVLTDLTLTSVYGQGSLI